MITKDDIQKIMDEILNELKGHDGPAIPTILTAITSTLILNTCVLTEIRDVINESSNKKLKSLLTKIQFFSNVDKDGDVVFSKESKFPEMIQDAIDMT